MGIAEIVPAHTFNFSRDDAVYWRKDTDGECPRISQIRGAGILLLAIVFPFLAGKHAAHSSSDPFPMQCVHILQSPSHTSDLCIGAQYPQKYILRFALGPGMENVIGNRISGFCIKR